MTFKELAKEICAREGKKQGVNIAQVSEILKCLVEICAERNTVIANGMLFSYPGASVTGPGIPKPKKKRGKRK